MAAIALFIYRVIGALIILPLTFFLRRHSNFQGTVTKRLGFDLPQVPAGRDTIWIHAASVGEVKAVSNLLKVLKSSKPDLFISMSSMTVTGRKVAAELPEVDCVFPLPFDLPWIMKRHLLRIMPKALFIVETEIWPNMILAAEKLAIPVVFVNARISVYSYKWYRRLTPVFKRILSHVKVFAMAEGDAARFRDIGARDVQVIGNLKLDQVATGDKTKAEALRQELGVGDRPVFIAGSVREGEETEVMDAIIQIAMKIPNNYSIIVPRHLNRIDYIKDIALRRSIKWALRSKPVPTADLLIVDTVGELFTLYGMSDAAFVGGSLINLGGQNILEPIAWGVPTLHGPYMSNFAWAQEAVNGHTTLVKNSRELAHAVCGMLLDRNASRSRGFKAKEVLLSWSGVTQRYISAINPFL
jgi:3-deoxy-D-manno-octulosonic-acid transferase